MRAREAAKIFVGDGMTDLTMFFSLADRVEEEGMAVQYQVELQLHSLTFVSLPPDTFLDLRHLPISLLFNDITHHLRPIYYSYHALSQATGAIVFNPASSRCLSPPCSLEFLVILMKTIEN